MRTRFNMSKDVICNMDYVQDDISIQTLTDDCLIYVFLELPIIDRIRIERVCRRWQVLSQMCWSSVKRLDFSYSVWGFLSGMNRREISTCSIQKVLRRCGSYLNEIDLSVIPYHLPENTINTFGKLCPNLKIIDISGLTVSTTDLKSLANNCHRIKKLSLGLTTPAYHICDTDLQQLFRVNPTLRYLKVFKTPITGRCLLRLPFNTIEEIILDSCALLEEYPLVQMIASLRSIKSLTIHKCFYISKNVIRTIGANCTGLKKLEISNIVFLQSYLESNDMLHVTQLINLEVLKVSRITVVTDKFLTILVSKCLRLTYLDITGCYLVTYVGIAAVATLPKLEVLIMNYLELATNISLWDTPNLKRLECCNSKFTDRMMIKVIDCAPQLRLLDLSECRNISNRTLEKAASRTNDTILKVFVGGTSVDLSTFKNVSPFLQIVIAL